MPVFTSSIEVTADYPTIKPSLNLNFVKARALDPRVTLERASDATYIGRDGLVKYAGEDEPRFDHDPYTLECLGLLLEESRTNLAEYGTIISGTGWYSQPTFGTNLNDSISPDGTANATRITNLNSQSDPDLYSFEQFAIGSSKTITHSIYVKSPDAANVGKEINFRGKRTVGTASSWGQKFILTAEWQRVTITHTYQSDNTQGRAYIGADPNTTDPAGAATACLFWGLQVEEGSFATSFIPTSGSTVTRAVDEAYILGDNVPLGSGVDEYSFYVRGRLLDTNNYAGISRGLVGMGSSSSNRIRIPHNNAGAVEIYSGGSVVAQLFTSDIGTTERQIALAVKKDDFAMSMDGGTVQTDTSGDIPSSIDTIGLGQSSYDAPPVTYPSTCYIREFRIYPKRLTNAQLQLLTS